MKKFTVLLCLFLLLLSSFLLPVSASQTTEISELGMQISISDAYHICTRENISQKALDIFEISDEDMMSFFKENDCYFDAVTESYEKECMVYAFHTGGVYGSNFNDLTVAEKNDLINELFSEYPDTSIVTFGDDSYIYVDFYSDGSSLGCYTIKDDVWFSVTLDSYDTENTEAIADEFEEIMNSVAFTSEPTLTYEEVTLGADVQALLPTQPQTVTLDEASLSITLPAEFIPITRDCKDGDIGLIILGISATDFLNIAWESDAHLIAITQDVGAEINVTVVENEDLAVIGDFMTQSDSVLNLLAKSLMESGLSDVTYSDYELCTIGDTKYIKLNFTDIDSQGIQYYTLVNGVGVNIILYCYDDAAYEQTVATFEQIIQDAVFTHDESLAGVNISTFMGLGIGIGIFILLFPLIVIAIVIIIVVTSKKKKAKLLQEQQAQAAANAQFYTQNGLPQNPYQQPAYPAYQQPQQPMQPAEPTAPTTNEADPFINPDAFNADE